MTLVRAQADKRPVAHSLHRRLYRVLAEAFFKADPRPRLIPSACSTVNIASSRSHLHSSYSDRPVATLVSNKKAANDLGYWVSSDREFFDGGSRLRSSHLDC